MQVVAFCPFAGSPQWYSHGAKPVANRSSPINRGSPRSSPPIISQMFARREADSVGAADALLTDGRGLF